MKIEIRCVGEAFHPDPKAEFARLLRDIANRVEFGELQGIIKDARKAVHS